MIERSFLVKWKQIFHIIIVRVEYYSGVVGELCNEESHVIRSKEECINALQKLGISFSSENHWTGSSQDIPSGCSIQDDIGRKPYFETSSTGLGKGRNDQAPICKNQLIYGKLILQVSWLYSYAINFIF